MLVAVIKKLLPQALGDNGRRAKLRCVDQLCKFFVRRNALAAPLFAIDRDRLAAASQYLIEAAYPLYFVERF